MVELRAGKLVPRQGRPQNSQDNVRRRGQPGIVYCHFGRAPRTVVVDAVNAILRCR
jgi:hypothetical protein